ncbi:hypothetical protein FIV00_02475 [Labrenzia sp. THAF82]|nr:hypothetical protein FIV00_02475 [Labrenzia sp. THAF82]
MPLVVDGGLQENTEDQSTTSRTTLDRALIWEDLRKCNRKRAFPGTPKCLHPSPQLGATGIGRSDLQKLGDGSPGPKSFFMAYTARFASSLAASSLSANASAAAIAVPCT